MYTRKNIITALTVCSVFALPLFITTTVHAEKDARPSKTPRVQELKLRADKMATKEAELKSRMASKSAEMDLKRDKMASKAAEIASKSAQRWEDRCKILSEKTTEKLNRHETNRVEHIENYMQAKKRLQEVITRLKGKGYDVAKLETDLTQLDTLIKKAAADYLLFTTALKDTKNYSCGKSEGAYATALKSSRDKLQTARQSLAAIRTYYQTTIRVDILAIKAQKSSRSPKASATANPSSTASAAPVASASPTASPTASPVPTATAQQ